MPTSSELDSKWLWVSSGGTDGYSEYCLTLNCDGYSHTGYSPVRDMVNWDQHLELTILFLEDPDNSEIPKNFELIYISNDNETIVYKIHDEDIDN